MQGKPHSDVVVKKVVEMVCVGGRMICNSKIDFSGVAVRATIGVEMDEKGKREGGGVM